MAPFTEIMPRNSTDIAVNASQTSNAQHSTPSSSSNADYLISPNLSSFGHDSLVWLGISTLLLGLATLGLTAMALRDTGRETQPGSEWRHWASLLLSMCLNIGAFAINFTVLDIATGDLTALTSFGISVNESLTCTALVIFFMIFEFSAVVVLIPALLGLMVEGCGRRQGVETGASKGDEDKEERAWPQ